MTPRQVPQDTAESILLGDVEIGLVSVGCQNGYMPFMVKIFFANNTLFIPCQQLLFLQPLSFNGMWLYLKGILPTGTIGGTVPIFH